MAEPQEIIEFFKKIHINDLDINTRNNVIHTLLNEYVLSRLSSIQSKDDQLYLGLENYSPLEPLEVFHILYK